jgi:hypothetical protein
MGGPAKSRFHTAGTTLQSLARTENRWTGEKVALFTWVDSLSSLANDPSKAEKLSLTLSSLRY